MPSFKRLNIPVGKLRSFIVTYPPYLHYNPSVSSKPLPVIVSLLHKHAVYFWMPLLILVCNTFLESETDRWSALGICLAGGRYKTAVQQSLGDALLNIDHHCLNF